MILDSIASKLKALAGITSGLITPSAATASYGILDSLTNEPALFVRDGVIYNGLGLASSDKVIPTIVAAAGSTVADAGQLGLGNVLFVSSDGAAKGVKLHPNAAGAVDVINTSATACELYAASGGTVNGLSADASIVVPASKGVRLFATAVNTWIAFDMPAKATAS